MNYYLLTENPRLNIPAPDQPRKIAPKPAPQAILPPPNQPKSTTNTAVANVHQVKSKVQMLMFQNENVPTNDRDLLASPILNTQNLMVPAQGQVEYIEPEDPFQDDPMADFDLVYSLRLFVKNFTSYRKYC